MNARFIAVDSNYSEMNPKSFCVLAVQRKDIPHTGSISDLVNCGLKLFITYVDRELSGPPIVLFADGSNSKDSLTPRRRRTVANLRMLHAYWLEIFGPIDAGYRSRILIAGARDIRWPARLHPQSVGGG
jgi:hypothetical protein